MGRPKVAFVGTGGATKGIAHLGVLKAMEELGLDTDIYVGASSGAIAGAFYAMGLRADEMVDWFRPFWKREAKDGLKGRYFLGLAVHRSAASTGLAHVGSAQHRPVRAFPREATSAQRLSPARQAAFRDGL